MQWSAARGDPGSIGTTEEHQDCRDTQGRGTPRASHAADKEKGVPRRACTQRHVTKQTGYFTHMRDAHRMCLAQGGHITHALCTAYHITVLGNWQLVWQAEIESEGNNKSLPSGLGGGIHVTALPRRMITSKVVIIG